MLFRSSPESVASVSMPLGGYVQAIKVMPGMKVQKGQVLAVVEDQAFVQLQQDYLTTKQQLTFATKDYQRQKELNASQASSDKSYQLAESEWAKYKITLKALDEKLRLIHINPGPHQIFPFPSHLITVPETIPGDLEKYISLLKQFHLNPP